MASNVKDIDRGLKRFVREVQNARGATVEIGIHENKFNDGLSIAEYAAYNEYGTENIPERSFMRSTFDEKLASINSETQRLYKQVQDGKITVHKALGLLGMRHKADIQLKISSNIQPANAPATIERKGSSKTLIDTGAMRQSIDYVVKI